MEIILIINNNNNKEFLQQKCITVLNFNKDKIVLDKYKINNNSSILELIVHKIVIIIRTLINENFS